MLSFICLLLLIGQGGTETVHYEGSGDPTNGSTVDSAMLSCPGLWNVLENTNGSTGCKCGDDLGGIVRCNTPSQILLRPCYCMTPYAKDPNITVVGACLSRCFGGYHSLSRVAVGELSYHMCTRQIANGKIKWRYQDGQLCGKCIKGFAPPVYAYHQRCVNCSHNEYSIKNSVKYCIIAFLPLTVFFIVLVTLRISATSPTLNAFVLACQVLASPLQVDLVLVPLSNGDKPKLFSIAVNLILSLLGFWNLDFFRPLYPGFCLHPNMSILQIIALDYVIAAHPLFLIAITYVLVELHDHNCKIVVLLWKPFLRCFARFRRQWDIQTSLIEAFASFLLLSYVKFLSVSLRFLLPVYVYNVYGESLETYLYYDGTIEYFGKQHLPYAILAIVVFIIFNILPLLLLCLYPCHCFQKILNSSKLRCQALHIFMDAFQGCYKNGTNGTRDYRQFSALYLFIRIMFFVTAAVSLGYSVVTFYFLAGVLFSLYAILIAITQPYKSSIYSIIDTVLIFAIALSYFFAMGRKLAHAEYSVLHLLAGIMYCLFCFIPIVYVIIVILSVLKTKPPQQCCLPFCKKLMGRRASNSEEPLPERMANPEECAALLHEPVSDQGTDGPPDQDTPSFEQRFL